METPIEVKILWHQQRTPDIIKLVPSIFTPTHNAEVFLDKYYKHTDAKAVVTMLDDCIIDSCKCSNCNCNIDISSRFCFNCGAKISGRYEIIEGDSNV